MESRELDLAYCAGIFDGEGCISVSPYYPEGRVRFHCDLFIGMQNKACLEFFQQTVGTGSITQRKDCWMYQATGPKASHVCRLLGQFLQIKKNQAELFIQFAATFSKNGVKPTPMDIVELRMRLSSEIRSFNKQDSNTFHNNGVNSVNDSTELIPSQAEGTA